jgi:hypothetical protein
MNDRSRRAPVTDRRAAQEQAERILAVLEAARPGAVARLGIDPLGELSTWDDLALRFIPAAQADHGCSVAGAYIAEVIPPVLAVVNALSTGRRAFTGLHELAHHLQQTTFALMRALLRRADGGRALEDAACDGFAARILLPPSLVDQILASGVAATGVSDLWNARPAVSRSAACVAAAQRLTAPGHVILLDAAGVVQFAAAHLLPPVRRESDQADIPLVRDALFGRARSARGRTRLIYRDGIQGQELYGQVADIGGYLVLVAVTDHAAWETGFHLPSPDAGPQGRDWICERCGDEFTTFDRPCPRCSAPRCRGCGQCSCAPTVAERKCERCNLVLPPSIFEGASTRCRDCA